jgi:GxxExxY protein
MNADSALTEEIIGAAFAVHKELGSGFLEAVYARALSIELTLRNIEHKHEVPLRVFYRGKDVGEYRADLLVGDCVVVEVKALNSLMPVHEQQLVNYLSATGKGLGLLINFGVSVTVKRKIITKNLRSSV